MINPRSQVLLQIQNSKNAWFIFSRKPTAVGDFSQCRISNSSTGKTNNIIYLSKKNQFFYNSNKFNSFGITFGKLLKNNSNVCYSTIYQEPSDLFRYANTPTFTAFSVENKSNKVTFHCFENENNSTEQIVNDRETNYFERYFESDQNEQKTNSLLPVTLFQDFNYPQMFISDALPIIDSKENTIITIGNSRQQDLFDPIEKYVNYFKNYDYNGNTNKNMLESTDNNSNKSNISEKPINRGELPADISNNPLSILHIINSVDRSEAIINKDLYITSKVIEEMEINKKKKIVNKTNDTVKRKVDIKRMSSDGKRIEDDDINNGGEVIPLDNSFDLIQPLFFDLK